MSIIVLLGALAQEHWPQFRGPEGRGVAAAEGLPDRWSASENVLWKTPVAGMGWSSPIVWGARVFLTTVVSEGPEEEPKKGLYFGGERPRAPASRHVWRVLCFDLESGRELWNREVHAGPPPTGRHIKNSYASETPCTDGERVYAYFGNVGLFVFDLEGKPVWEKRWPVVRTRYGWGTAASPIVHDGRLYVLNDNEEGSFLEALEAPTGKLLWRVERDEKSNWSTPFVWTNSRRRELITTGSKYVRSYDLEGKLLWELPGMSTITIPTPFADGDLLVVAAGYVGDRTRSMYGVGPGGAEAVRWHDPTAAPYNPTPVLADGIVYVLYDRGFLAAFGAADGKPVYEKQRLREGASAFTASPWAYGGKIFCLSEEGDTFVVAAGREYRLLHENALGEMCMATPAIARGSLLVRSQAHLWRVGARR